MGKVPKGSVRIEGEERLEPSAAVQPHGCMAGEAQTKYIRREGGEKKTEDQNQDPVQHQYAK